MARPIKAFTPDEARKWILTLSIKADKTDFDRNIVRNDDEDWGVTFERQRKAKDAIHVMYKKHRAEPGEDANTDLRAWIDAYLTPESWVRLQAAERQKKHSAQTGSRERITKIAKSASWFFDRASAAADVTKKDYMNQLADWLANTKEGKAAAQQFNDLLQLQKSTRAPITKA